MKGRLYLQLYAALLASAFLCLVVAAIAFRLWRDSGGPPAERMRRAAVMLPESVPDVRAPDARTRVEQVADDFGVDVVIGDEQGVVVGVPSPRGFPVPRHPLPGWRRDRGGPVLVTPLEGGGWAAVRPRRPYRHLRLHPFFTTLVILALVMAVGSYPVARRVTRRIETLARAVERWGRGELHHRVPVAGNDEVATLAATFNQAADRLDVLLGQQRQMLANASHELRSPLARLRMGLELIGEEPDATRRQAMVEKIHRDIVELDGLIEDVLLFARADARVPTRPLVEVDLRALVEDEAARTGASVEPGPSPKIAGDGGLLRHLVRNLLENAQQHGGGAPVRALIAIEPAGAATVVNAGDPAPAASAPSPPGPGALACLTVEDQGPGVPEEERERIFAPFYRRAGAGGPGSPTGHGLGLALVRQVARYHGGEAVHRARPEGGSRFEVRIPLAPAPAPAAEAAS